ncbi:hypothetical protein ADL21_32960 [Streptomyces albus subsp. albus]|nr:hypothetical protein ADL21_32960 [Streptomyces albus subsp. albus]
MRFEPPGAPGAADRAGEGEAQRSRTGDPPDDLVYLAVRQRRGPARDRTVPADDQAPRPQPAGAHGAGFDRVAPVRGKDAAGRHPPVPVPAGRDASVSRVPPLFPASLPESQPAVTDRAGPQAGGAA